MSAESLFRKCDCNKKWTFMADVNVLLFHGSRAFAKLNVLRLAIFTDISSYLFSVEFKARVGDRFCLCLKLAGVSCCRLWVNNGFVRVMCHSWSPAVPSMGVMKLCTVDPSFAEPLNCKGRFTLSISGNASMLLGISLRLNCLHFLINQVSHSKNGSQPELIRYDASVDANTPN